MGQKCPKSTDLEKNNNISNVPYQDLADKIWKNFGWRWANEVSERMTSKMKKNKEKKVKNKEQKKYDKGQVFVKIMAGILALLMVLSVAGSLVFYLL